MNENEFSVSKEVNELLGYGKKLDVFIGLDGEGKEIKRTFHFCPVPLKDVPTLSALLFKFFEDANKGAFNEKAVKTAAQIIKLSLDKTTPDITIEKIMELFSLGTLATAIKIVMDVNDFFTQMQALNQMTQELTVNQKVRQ